MNILFVIPKVKSLFGDEGATPAHPHVGVAYLVAFLKQHNIDTAVFDEGLEKNDKKLFEFINNFRPDLIGITSFSYCYQYSYETIKKLKEKFDIPIIVGGPHVSAVKGEILKETNADFAIKGEGEYTFLELINQIQKRKHNFKNIKGLLWRKNNKIIENENRPYIENLDSLPIPAYENCGLEKYPCHEQKTLPIITSRGCPYRCNFCSVRLSMGNRFRARSAENVVDEIEYWYKKGFRLFEINDDCFSFDIKRAMKICDLIIKRKLKITYQLYNGIRVDRINKELLRKMKQSGCVFISYGCEAGNEQILKNIRKGITLEQVQQVVNWTNEIGIKSSTNFIIGHPGETYETAMDSIRFAESLPCDFVNFYNLVPYPGTDLFEWVKTNNLFLVPPEIYLKDISYRDASPIFETKEFTKEEREKALRKGFNLYEKKILQFRFGKKLGYIFYLLTRVKPLNKLGRNFILYNKIGRKLFFFLSKKSRK